MPTSATIGAAVGGAILAGGVLAAVLLSPAPAPATGRLSAEQTQAWSELEEIQQTLAEARDARQALVRARARVTAARAELQAAQADLAAIEAGWPDVREKAQQARARWDEVRQVEMPEALRGSQWAGMDRVVQEWGKGGI